MANSILKLTVESSEYDAKLKKAAEGIRHLAEVAHRSGGDMTGLEKAELDYIKALGDMETKSRSASGKVRELSSAYKELTVTYNELNDVEKADEGGKALAASLEKLKQRAQEAQSQMDAATKSLQSNTTAGNEDSSMLSKLADKFTINIDALKLFNIGLQAADGALGLVKDAFFASEQNIDEWGRVVASGESVYKGFLTALNTGDISGYLNNINTIINAAREAYNELDRLSTQKAIDNSRSKAQQTENERMRAMLRTGRYIAPNDGRKAAMAEGTILTDAQKQRIAQQLENGLKTANSIVRSEIDQTTKAINALYKEQASVLQMSSKEFRAGTSSMAEFDKRLEGYKNYVDFERQHTYNDGRSAVSHRDNAINPYEQYKAWGVFKDDGKLFQKINDLINQRASLQSQNYSNVAQAYRSINTATNPGSGGGGSRGGSGGGGGGNDITYAEGSITAQTKLVQELTKQWNDASEEMKNGYLYQLVEAEQKLKEMKESDAFNKKGIELLYSMKNGEGASPAGIADSLMPDMKAIEEELAKNPIKLHIEIDEEKIKNIKAMAGLQKTAKETAQIIGTIGQAFNSIEDPAARVAGVVAQAIANIALAYSDALAKDQTSKFNIWGFLAASAASLISMTTAISQVHSSTGYAEGGIIKGNSYSGDNIPIMANAGEVVLTKAMTNNLAAGIQSQMTNNLAAGIQSQGMGGWQLKTRLAGTDLLLSVERTLQKQGYGKIATWG